ncbi:MAG: GNAT family N-acetyltransferase [Chloroflexi bacterium]|nr:GNAT family N-acetyltransferase [Chloroflexota bacterium]
MIRITSDNVTSALRSLFRTDEPQACRCFALLDGIEHTGKIITDDPANPTWGVVWEACDGVTFLGGRLDPATLARVFANLRKEHGVLVGLWDGDPRHDLLPPDPYYDGRTLEFYDRPIGRGLDAYLRKIPEGCEIRRLDRDLIMRTEWGPDDVQFAGGIEAWEKTRIGYCLMRGDEILCKATVGPPAIGLREPGVFTQKEHRSQGYATITAARLIKEVEALGDQTYWDCAKQNVASAAVARKLGYRIEKEYRCVAWDKSG